ncbi:MAG: UDP-N-acetylglucosamine 1-carboxyvinyltransferase [Rickettsiales bacterium]|nr:UDP-N-acetylglucosamine 1-carboxyvinyltransferase [Rickettsiales bacterium]
MPVKKAVVSGGNPLMGEIKVSGAKNSALYLICASLLLKEGTLTLNNIPNIADVCILLELLNFLGASVTLDSNKTSVQNGKTIVLDTNKVEKCFAPSELVSKMRASFNVLGPLLARFGEAKVSLPGGCNIGTRGFDIHFDSLKKMGVDLQIKDDYIVATTKKLKGATIDFRIASVGATQNIMSAAVLADGKTTINNAAKEPYVVDLANCLNSMGAKIKGAGTSKIEIEGVTELHSSEFTTMGDIIEAGSFMIGAIMTDGDLILSGLDFSLLENVSNELRKIGASIEYLDRDKIHISKVNIKRKGKLEATKIITDIWPGFPTDLQAPLMSLLAMVDGKSEIDETIFENRFMHVAELNKMNAKIEIVGNKAVINGQENCYKPAKVTATDLRAGLALTLAGLTTKGETEISRYFHVERGYEFIMDKINNCNGNIKITYE